MNNPQAESFILTSRARTIDDFFIAIREWEEFALDREPSPSQYTPSMPVAVPIATRAEHEPLTPTLVASLIKRFETQGQVAEVGARSKPAAPVSPGNSLSSFQHPHQQATFRPTPSPNKVHTTTRELIAHLLLNHPLVVHPSNLPRIPKWHNRQRHVAGAVFDVARWIIE